MAKLVEPRAPRPYSIYDLICVSRYCAVVRVWLAGVDSNLMYSLLLGKPGLRSGEEDLRLLFSLSVTSGGLYIHDSEASTHIVETTTQGSNNRGIQT